MNNSKIKKIAKKYCGGELVLPAVCAKIDRKFSQYTADCYQVMKHDPENLEVREAYEALAKETVEQYRAVLITGLKIEFIKGIDPYAKNPRLAIADITENNHLWVFSTMAGFGSNDDFKPENNPLLACSGFKISGQKACINDLFRVIHDFFGHAMLGNGFRAAGEETAYRVHAAMFSKLARKALASETRGQNSWLNFGPHGEHNRTAKAEFTIFADQKTGLLPEFCINAYL